jgi:hypothetical protein
MSLKFAALSSLAVFGNLGSARADDMIQNLRPAAPHEPILITFGPKSSEAGASKREDEVIKQEARASDRF